MRQETDALIGAFEAAFTPKGAPHGVTEESQRTFTVTRANLNQWFKEAMLTHPLSLDQADQASPLDLVRIFDYPGDFVPVVVGQGSAATQQRRSYVIDKGALSLQLARAYVTDLLDESRV